MQAAAHHQIVKCDIQLNENIFNTIRIGDESIPASEFIPSCYRRVLHADPLILDAKDNAPSQRRPLRMSYAQSFMKEEVGKMYRGELIIRGNPDIEPFDVILLTDEATGLHGPIEVESITHIFNQEMGFVSVIVPRAMIMMNESATADLIQAFWMDIHNHRGFSTRCLSPLKQKTLRTRGRQRDRHRCGPLPCLGGGVVGGDPSCGTVPGRCLPTGNRRPVRRTLRRPKKSLVLPRRPPPHRRASVDLGSNPSRDPSARTAEADSAERLFQARTGTSSSSSSFLEQATIQTRALFAAPSRISSESLSGS